MLLKDFVPRALKARILTITLIDGSTITRTVEARDYSIKVMDTDRANNPHAVDYPYTVCIGILRYGYKEVFPALACTWVNVEDKA